LAVNDADTGGGIRHVAWLYRTPSEYLAGIRGFVHAGASAGEPVLVAVPAGRLSPGWNLPVEQTGAHSLDAARLGRNPARLMPAVREFADHYEGQRVRVISELTWGGRSSAELGEVARYEAMANVFFAATPITMLCPYNAAGLPGRAIAAACESHPWLRDGRSERHSDEFRATADSRSGLQPPLQAPPGARVLSYWRDLRPVRELVAAEAARAGLSGTRQTDLVIAASEVAANTLKHTAGAGLLSIWVTDDEILCQLDDSGLIDDPLAGYGRPAGDALGGQGLWLVNQVCDLAEVRTGAVGTTIRLHMFRDMPPASVAEERQVRQPGQWSGRVG
jgi:anti-sigma regulatory factor (Ser/Thr protein kinase)